MKEKFVSYLLKIKFLIICVTLLSIIIGCSESTSSNNTDDDLFTYVTPEEVGYSSEALAEVEQLAEESGYAAMMAVHDGKVFFSWGNIANDYLCHSIRKPFLGSLYGIHTANGNIDLNSSMEDLDIDDIPPSLTVEEKQSIVQYLLQSRSGIYHEAAAESQEMINSRPERGSHAPGTFFYYNNGDFNTLGTIFIQETGFDIYEEFKTAIADQIGMQDFDVNDCYYQYELDKSMHPAYHFRMSARDMARFGVLYQQNGSWEGNQIIPNDWIEESTTSYSVADSTSGLGYGYMWRIIPEGTPIASYLGYPGYYHTGIGVHALVIIPELKLVIVQRLDTDGDWVDPDNGMELGIMIVNARIP